MQPIIKSYEAVRHQIADGDVLLRRSGRDPVDVAIAAGGRGRYCHAALAAWWHDSLMCLETRQWFGSRAVTLSSQVAAAPAQWDVFGLRADLVKANCLVEANCDEVDYRNRVVREMVRICGCPYGWRSMFRVALVHLPVARLFARGYGDEIEDGHAPFCSEAVSSAWRKGASIDLVPELSDAMTEPADLARSGLLAYRFTLVP